MRRVFHIALATLLPICAGCQTAPPAASAASPIADSDAGMVIGTVSYAHADLATGARALLRMQRLSAHGASQTYLFDLVLDARQDSGYFAGTLPSGIYAVDEALAPGTRLVPARASLPFEVTAGRVTDAGHTPLEAQPAQPQLSAR